MLALVLAVGAAAVIVGWVLGRRIRSDTDRPEPDDDANTSSLATSVLDRHPTSVVVADAQGRIGYRNAAAREMFGTHVGVLIDEAVERHLEMARDGGSADETLELFGPPNRVVVISGEPLSGGGSVAFVDDVTDRRRADRARTDFVANVSHELRTPIGALAVLAESLGEVDDPEVVDRVVARMRGEAERASRTIDDLLELSEIESVDVRVREDVRVASVVSGAVARVGELAAQRTITIVRLGDDLEELVVLGDAPHLTSAVGNLIENAVKYSDDGASVVVETARVDGAAEITVRDEGVGIPRQDLPRIFERFYRVDRARSRGTGGTGLGLSIVRHVAENHGGTVWVSSTEGEGSEFVVRLPLTEATDVELGQNPRRREEIQ